MKALTGRQSRFVEGVLQGRSYAQAAREAGYAESVANCAGRKIAAKPEVQTALKEAEEKKPRLAEADRELLTNFNALPHWPQAFIGRLLASLAAEDWENAVGQINLLRWLYDAKVKAGMEK
jgi:hypothetical protein